MSIKSKLKSSELGHYWGVCLKMGKDSAFRQRVLAAYDSPDMLYFKHPGAENADRNVYMIYCDSAKRGFFSLFNLVLDGLQFAEYYHMTPVVEWGPSTLYHEEHGYNGVMNSFEYYFEQPADITPESAKHSQNVVYYDPAHRKLSLPGFHMTLGASLTDEKTAEAYLNLRAETIRKYIRFTPEIQQYFTDSVGSLLGSHRTLGVHVRATDMRAGYRGHTAFITPEQYLEAAKENFEKGHYEQLFLATDEAAVIQLFEKTFGNKMVYYKDILRSEDGEALHFSKNVREYHKYLLGREVLRDMYTLSVCSGLVASASNVPIAAQMMKKSMHSEYDCKVILNNGFNKDNGISMNRK